MVTPCAAATMSQPQNASPVPAPESFEAASLKLVALATEASLPCHRGGCPNSGPRTCLLSLAYGIDPRYIKGVPAHLLHAAHKDPFRTVLCWAPHELRAKQVPVAILPGLPQ
jgi:hypothetical protein